MNDDERKVAASIKRLRDDALARDMKELAITYGWSLIDLGLRCLSRAEQKP